MVMGAMVRAGAVMPRDADLLLLSAIIRQASSPEECTSRSRISRHVQASAHGMPAEKPPSRAHGCKGRLQDALNIRTPEPALRRAEAYDGKVVAADAGAPPLGRGPSK